MRSQEQSLRWRQRTALKNEYYYYGIDEIPDSITIFMFENVFREGLENFVADLFEGSLC